ncbi:Hypothetical protein FKW44_010038 [Caligus rogercresseyi]|uniref:Uncharacterized protein n=1 Tax=Caligus rogercresseyi TaxID=217165 RepID=A0A7T8HG61_CALRO|nr:Hypothetical protein FKW44_010038 [Caligus rogercresseyi]
MCPKQGVHPHQSTCNAVSDCSDRSMKYCPNATVGRKPRKNSCSLKHLPPFLPTHPPS